MALRFVDALYANITELELELEESELDGFVFSHGTTAHIQVIEQVCWLVHRSAARVNPRERSGAAMHRCP
ncbi:hypothetical protein ACFCWV_34665, partial [Streptomyces sp. NPDC056341]|uniref:hypothetical protein n=1 Tax=Streptomyces sp. NPDC056341 TaxID=3345788 RepID=UPI0035DDC1B5